MRYRVCMVVVIFCLGALESCGGGNSGGSGINIAGNWQVTANSTVFGFSYTASGQVNQNGSALSGSLALSGTPCAESANFTGNLSGNKITATLDENGQNTMYTGTVSADGNSASGTYQSPAGGCTDSDAGTFSGQRVSMLNGMFIGSFGPENSIPANIVTQLHDEGGNVSGSATITNSLCFHSMNVTGNVSGFKVELHGADIQADFRAVTFHGTFNQQNKSLALYYLVAGGSCSGESGTAQLKLLR
jgi:hypothetical protein